VPFVVGSGELHVQQRVAAAPKDAVRWHKIAAVVGSNDAHIEAEGDGDSLH
jgi:hypothetical protein